MVGRELRILSPHGEDHSGQSKVVVMGGDMKHGGLRQGSSANWITVMEMMKTG